MKFVFTPEESQWLNDRLNLVLANAVKAEVSVGSLGRLRYKFSGGSTHVSLTRPERAMVMDMLVMVSKILKAQGLTHTDASMVRDLIIKVGK